MTAPSVTPKTAEFNPIRTGADWQRLRDHARQDPGAFHGEIAAREIHWFDPPSNAWLTLAVDGTWRGFDAVTGAAVTAAYATSHRPWARAFDDEGPDAKPWR